MRSVPLAMTWEFLTFRRWWLIAAALGANALPMFVLIALRHEGGGALNVGDPSMIMIHILFVQLNIFVFGAALMAAQSTMSRLYVYPIPSSTIAAWRMLPAMILMAVELMVCAAFCNAVFGLDWPIWGPALFAAVSFGAVQSVLWFTEKTAWISVGLFVVAGMIGLWFKSRYGETFSRPWHFWQQLTPTEFFTLSSIAIVAFGVGVISIGRNRRGESIKPLGIIDWLTRVLDPAAYDGEPFRSPEQAQRWYEWRQKGWVMPVIVVFGLTIGGIIWLLFIRDPVELYHGLVVGGFLLSVGGLVGGIALGNAGPTETRVEMGPFLATRPLPTRDLARMILLTAARSILVAWSWWALAFLAMFVFLAVQQSLPRPVLIENENLSWWYLPLTLIGPWIVTGVSMSLTLTGRSTAVARLLCGVLLAYILTALFAKVGLSEAAQMLLGQIVLVIVGVASLAITAIVFQAARRRSLIDGSTIVASGAIWGILAGLAALMWSGQPVWTWAGLITLLGFAALAVLPLAAAPLALSYNRHR